MSVRHDEGARFRTDIQGLRAVAVGGVVLDHINFPHVTGGFAGVDVFFVISGFLITDHLARGLTTDGRIAFADFYARRARRILPASFLVLLATLVASMSLLPVTMRPTSLDDAIATALYVPNYLFAFRATDYFASPTPSLYQHYWSLGVEEQFYLVWPLILAGAYSTGVRISRKVAWRLCQPRAVLLFAVVVAGLVSAWFNHHDLESHEPSRAFFWATGRAWEFAVGGFVALVADRSSGRGIGPTSIRTVLGWLGLCLIGFAYANDSGRTPWPGMNAAVPVAGAALVILCGRPGARLGASRLLEIRPLPWIGTLSYSIYLVHWPLIQFVKASNGYGVPLSPSLRLGLAALSIPVAWLLYRFVENPMRFASGLRSTRRALTFSAASSLVIVVLAFGLVPVAESQKNRLLSRLGDAQGVVELTAPPTHVTTFVPRNLDPAIGASNAGSWLLRDGCLVDGQDPAATTPHPCYHGDRSVPRMALVGDSEAAAMGPALAVVADRMGLSLEANTNSGCEFLKNPSRRTGCPGWRNAVLASLRRNPPEFIVIVQQGDDGYAPPQTDPETEFKRGLADFLSDIGSIPVVILQVPLLAGTDIPTCLAAQLDSVLTCAVPAGAAIDSNAHRAEASFAAEHPAQVHLVDLTAYFCTPRSCPPIIGNTRVWLDDHHPTTAFATLLGPVIAKKLAESGIRRPSAS